MNLEQQSGDTDDTEQETASNLERSGSASLRWGWWSSRRWLVGWLRSWGWLVGGGGVLGWWSIGWDVISGGIVVGSWGGNSDQGSQVRLGGVADGLIARGGWLISALDGRSGDWLIAWVGDTELGRVLVLTVRVNDDLDTVAGLVVLKIGLRRPGVGTSVLEFLNNWIEWENVLRWTPEQDDADGARLSWTPGDPVWLADWNDSTSVWGEDWVRGLVVCGWGGISQGRGRKGEDRSEDGSEGRHLCVVVWYYYLESSKDWNCVGLKRARAIVVSLNKEWTTTTM